MENNLVEVICALGIIYKLIFPSPATNIAAEIRRVILASLNASLNALLPTSSVQTSTDMITVQISNTD